MAAPWFARASLAQGASEPEWPQFQGGPGHPGALAEGAAPPYRVRWTFPVPEGSLVSGAVIADGLAITLGERGLYAVDLATGEIAWEVDRSGGPLSMAAVVAGTPSMVLYLDGPSADDGGASGAASPSASEGSPSTSSPTASASSPPSGGEAAEGSALVAIDLEDQAELWRVSLGATSRTGVTVDGDAAYVADQDGTVYAVALADGAVRWTADAGERVDVPIAVADGQVIAIARNLDDRSVAVNALALADGKRLWQRVAQINSSAASAAAARDDRVVVGFADRLVRSLGGGDGVQVWSALTLSFFSPLSSPAYQSESVYVADLGGGLYRLDPQDGGRVWSYQFNEVVLRSSPVVSGEAVLLGLDDGRLVAVDAGTGHLIWQSAASPGRLGPIALAHDVVVVAKGGNDAGLIAFEHDPDGELVDVPSPTELDAATTLSRLGIAAAIALAVVVGPGLLALRRFGTAFAPEEEGADEDGEAAEDDMEDEP